MSGEEVKRETYSLISAFYRQYGIKPNTVYLGHDEYYAVIDDKSVYRDIDNDNELLFGLDMVRTTKDQYLSVGLSI